MLAHLSARASFSSAEHQKNTIHEFYAPIFKQFDEINWDSLPWTKFVCFLLVCNGGSNHLMSVEDVDETV